MHNGALWAQFCYVLNNNLLFFTSAVSVKIVLMQVLKVKNRDKTNASDVTQECSGRVSLSNAGLA